jgi:hypothetical protein
MAAGVAVTAFRGPDPLGFEPPPTVWRPSAEISARFGLAEGVDCGAKAWPVFLRGDCKLELIRSPLFDAAVAPALAMQMSVGAILVDAYLTMLFDLNLHREPWQAGAVSLIGTVAPIGRCYLAEGRDTEGCWMQLAYSGGLAVTVTDRLVLFAEVSQYRTVINPGPAMGTSFLRGVHAGIGFQFRAR